MKILTRKEVIEIMNDKGIDITNRLMLKVVDHSNNSLAPEKYCYKLYFTDVHTKKRTKLALWPNTVGYQGF